jgi:hypothetical protein
MQMFQEDDSETYVMLFQLIGIPNLNQKAREVPPFKRSLVSSGVFLLLAHSRLFFWIGLDFYNNYLDTTTFTKESELISEELLNKLLVLYNRI